MSNVVNLNHFRKAKAKAEKAAQSAANRARHGRRKGDKVREKAETEQARNLLDGAKRDDDGDRAE